jgi:hypothetical protein
MLPQAHPANTASAAYVVKVKASTDCAAKAARLGTPSNNLRQGAPFCYNADSDT